LRIQNLQIASGDTLKFRADVSGYQPQGLAELTIKGRALDAATPVLGEELPRQTDFDLRCVPNPFNAATTLEFFLQTPQDVTLEVFDMSGRLIKVLVAQNFPAGRRSSRNAALTQ